MFKEMKEIGIIRKLNKALPQHPHLGYSDIIYD